jgi:Transposase and inactivated derivatives
MSSQKGGVNDLVCPDLSKAQDKNEFLFFAVLLNFFRFFPKKIMAYVEYPVRVKGSLSHCDYPIHNDKLEGVNNKIKVIKRKAYGFRDLRYFTLKIYQAFFN